MRPLAGVTVGEVTKWIHLEAIQALVHHATAVATAIFLFALTARLISYLIPDGPAKRLVLIVDDIILLAVFALAGYRLLTYLLERPHLAAASHETPAITSSQGPLLASETQTALALCRAGAKTSADLRQCLERQLDFSEQMLADAAAQFNSMIHALPASGSAKVELQTDFNAAGRKFVEFRHAECAWRGAIAGPQTPENRYLACRADLTRGHAREIERALGK